MAKKVIRKRGIKVAEQKLSKAEQAKKLIQQANELIEGAKQEQLAIIHAAIDELRELGFTYSITEVSQTQKTASRQTKASGQGKSSQKAASSPSAKYNADRFCKVCNTKGHDTKAHNFHKEKFSGEELAAKGWATPESQAAQA